MIWTVMIIREKDIILNKKKQEQDKTKTFKNISGDVIEMIMKMETTTTLALLP